MRPPLGRLLAGVLVAASAAMPALAQQMPVPVDVQFSLFYRILTYDRHLEQRTAGGLVIGIVYQPGFRASALARDEAMRQPVPSGAGYTVRLVTIPFDADTDIGESAAKAGCKVLYLTPLRAVDVEALATAIGDRGILTLTGVPEYVSAGIAVGIGLRGDRPEIIVNLAAARQGGADFSAQLLRLARVQ